MKQYVITGISDGVKMYFATNVVLKRKVTVIFTKDLQDADMYSLAINAQEMLDYIKDKTEFTDLTVEEVEV